MPNKIIIIGGVAGGMSAATRLRRLQEDAEIIVFEKGAHVSFANCGLPYYLGGEITDRNALIVKSAAELATRFNLDIREQSEVVAIDPAAKTVTVRHAGGDYQETYDQLILSPGAAPIVPPLAGLDTATNVFTLRNLTDADRINDYVTSHQPRTAVVIGAGAIGLEMVEGLVDQGLAVTLVDQATHVLPAMDIEMSASLQAALIRHGVDLRLEATAKAIAESAVTLADGERIAADLVILSVGVRPTTDLAVAAGLALGETGGIKVDNRYQTSAPDIYAVGDAIEVNQQLTDTPALISLASPANRQGRQVADILSGVPSENRGSIGTAIVRVFDQVAATTGLSEAQAQRQQLDHQVVHISGNDHAGYYPGAQGLWLKLIFNPTTGKIYGAAAVGPSGVDKRIDVLATAIKGGLTVFDLPELELTYAPPFGVAKDPVNMIGYVASNIALGLSKPVQWHQLAAELDAGKQLLDVRTAEEFAGGHFRGAINIPLDELRNRVAELDANQDYIVSCQSGLRSYNAERILRGHDFKVENLDGAIGLYRMVSQDLIEA